MPLWLLRELAKDCLTFGANIGEHGAAMDPVMIGTALKPDPAEQRSENPRSVARAWLAALAGVFLLGQVHPGLAAPVNAAEADWQQFDRLVARAQPTTMANPEIGLNEARQAAALAERHKGTPRYRTAAATALWLEAEALTRMSRIPEARVAVMAASRLVAAHSPPIKLDGDLALSRGRIAESSGDFGTALKEYQRAHTIFGELGFPRGQSLSLFGLGDLYGRARDFDRETTYYREAALAYPGDPAIALAAANNLGFAYEQMGRYRLAIPRFQRALSIAAPLHSPTLEASILNNLAISYARLRKFAQAKQAAARSLALLRTQDDPDEPRFAWGAKAEADYGQGNLKDAQADLQKAFSGVNLARTTPPFRDLHEIAYRVYLKAGDYPRTVAHLQAFKRLDDQGRSMAASANLALLGARFDFARQDLEIAHLRSAQLERDIKLRQSRAELQLLVFGSIVLAGLLLLGWGGWRHALLARHRNEIAKNNLELTRTLKERDNEIVRRAEVESRLRVAMETAQQANRAKSVFLANMSHELRTPLNAIIGFAELMLDQRTKAEKSREYAGNVVEGGRHLLGVLNNVLDMARIESGKVELEDHLVRFSDVIDHAMNVLGTETARAGKELRSSGDRELVLRCDELRLRQILINLVSNALKYTHDGGLIEVRVEQSGEGVDLVVEDDGDGIPADKLPTIMEPFAQAETTYTRSQGGIGLGLSIVRSLVELHGGQFTLESEHGVGTRARVHLPKERVVGSGECPTPLDGEPAALAAAV